MTTESFNRMATATGLGFLVLHLPGAPEGVPLVAARWPEDDDADGTLADREALRFAYALLIDRLPSGLPGVLPSGNARERSPSLLASASAWLGCAPTR